MNTLHFLAARAATAFSRGLTLLASVSILALLAGALAPAGNAAPADLDPTFGSSGKVTTAIGSGDDQAQAAAVQADGKLVVAGFSRNGSNYDFALVRYTTNGSLDTSFNGTGIVNSPSFGSNVGHGAAMAVQSDGKMVVGSWQTLVRYNANGSLDTSFNGTGIVSTYSFSFVVGGIAVQSDGKVVVGGYASVGGTNKFAVARYNANGSLDTTFNGTGRVTTAVGSGADIGRRVALQSDGKIVLAGYSSRPTFPDREFAVVRYNANGSLDTSFNGTGKVTTDFGSLDDEALSVAVQSNGKIVLAGWGDVPSRDILLARYNANGSLDTSFNGTGKVTTAIGSGVDLGYSVALQSDGKILVGGYSGGGAPPGDFALVRYNSNGSLDTSFNGIGKLTTAIGSGNDFGTSVVVQSNGKIVVAGFSQNGSNYDFALVRYLGDTAAPEIAVEQPLSTNLADGGSKPFGSVVVGMNTSLTFTVRNTGTATLTGLAVTKDGPDAAMFTVTANPSTSVSFPNGSTTFTVRFTPSTTGTKTAAIHIASNDADENPFDITLTGTGTTSSALPVSLTVQGPSSMGAGGTASYTSTATYSGGATADVSGQAQWSVSGGPSGTHMIGSTLVAGSGPASTAIITASIANSTGSRTGSATVTIGAELSVGLHSVSHSYVSGSGSSLIYRIQAMASPSGGTGTESASWMLDSTAIGTGTGLVLDANVPASPGNHTLKVLMTGGATTPQATTVVFLPKAPQVNEQFPIVGAKLPNPGTLFAASAAQGFDSSSGPPASKGLVVIIHGMDSRVTAVPGPTGLDDWMKRMAEAITTKLSGDTPKIILYDWSEDADTTTLPSKQILAAMHAVAVELWPPNKGFGRILLETGEASVNTAGKLVAVTGEGLARIIRIKGLITRGELHGQALADYLTAEIVAGRVDWNAPIHLIGHSAGGFVAATCGGLLMVSEDLQQQGKKPTKLHVTTLDTPLLKGYQVNHVQTNGGKFERNVSSAIGVAVPDVLRFRTSAFERLLEVPNHGQLAIVGLPFFSLLNGLGVRPKPGFDESLTYHSGEDTEVTSAMDVIQKHQNAHEWYIHTVQDPDSFEEGFYYSRFPGGHPFPGGGEAAPASLAATATDLDEPDGSIRAPLAALSGFSTFGNVVESSGTYTLTELGNAGIYQSVTLPMNASSVKFRAQFTQPGDGDFIEVSFGDHLSLAVIADGPLLRSGPVEFELPVGMDGGETGQLLFKLNGVGADNAVVVIDTITITTADDGDGDGLTFAQETALGTDPRYPDTDADGLSDAEEVDVYFTNPLLADTDGDGTPDDSEIAAGTDPNAANSSFRVTDIQRTPTGSVVLTWPSVPGKAYQIWRATDLTFTNFDVIASGLSAATSSLTYTDTSPPVITEGGVFYRVTLGP